MGSLRRFNLPQLLKNTAIRTLVETGTGTGASTAWALSSGIEEAYSVELEPTLLRLAQKRLARFSGVNLFDGQSTSFLRENLPKIAGPKLVFLDAHFAGGADFQLTSYAESTAAENSFPLLEELAILGDHLGREDILIIDDARLYHSGHFQNGECPSFCRHWHELDRLESIIDQWSATHVMLILGNDEGYICVVPTALEESIEQWLNILPVDASQQELQFYRGIPGVTAISMLRRLHDTRFATRYFLGNGIDVGGGIDSLALYREFFPLAQSVFVYDQIHGDAQNLANVADEAFDFLYSSHCLEHLRDPQIAISNWLRVVKPGGHLVIQVPDEDLYEQGHWPSQFNSDHKLTFTIAKAKSWSPVSVNLLDLVSSFRESAELIAIGKLDQGYRYGLQGNEIDQTQTPMGEAAIEVVLQKRIYPEELPA